MKKPNLGAVALRTLAEGSEPGALMDTPVEVCLRESDFQVIEVKNPQTNQPQAAPTVAKVQFQAQRWRELTVDNVPSGCFEFHVKDGQSESLARVFLSGDDILYVKARSRLV